MHPIIYDVAVSIDGYIAGPEGDITGFADDGAVVDDYAARMATYRVAIMGRATYEFGYRFGLKPGQNPYPAMRTIVFSQSLVCPDDCAVDIRRQTERSDLERLKHTADGPIYLCGGGTFAGQLLDWGLIDICRFKRAPIVLGSGTHLFGGQPQSARLEEIERKAYPGGYIFQVFRVQPR